LPLVLVLFSNRDWPDDREWKDVEPEFQFVEEYEDFRSKVKGKGNFERFDYWLNSFKHLKK
jgi:hypothetical protein